MNPTQESCAGSVLHLRKVEPKLSECETVVLRIRATVLNSRIRRTFQSRLVVLVIEMPFFPPSLSLLGQSSKGNGG